MEKLKALLYALRLLDEEGRLSITNIAVIVMMVKIAMLQDAGMEDISLAMITMLNYGYKKKLSKGK